MDGDGQIEWVLSGDAAGTNEPEHTYILMSSFGPVFSFWDWLKTKTGLKFLEACENEIYPAVQRIAYIQISAITLIS